MNEPESKRAIVDRYHHAIAISDYATVLALHAPEVVCWMSGRSIVSGRFQGREALFEHMGRNVLGPLIVGTEDYVKGARILIEDGPFVGAIFHGGLPSKTGGRYDQYYLQLFRIEDGLIQEIVELFDTVMYEQAVAGNRLETARRAPDVPFRMVEPLPSAIDRPAMMMLADAFAARAPTGDVGDLLAPDAELRMIGTTPLSGVAPFDAERLRAIFSGGVGWSRVACTDAGAAILLMRAADPDYRQNYGVLLEAFGDRIGRICVFADTVEVEAHQFGNAMLPGATRRIMPAFDPRLAFA